MLQDFVLGRGSAFLIVRQRCSPPTRHRRRRNSACSRPRSLVLCSTGLQPPGSYVCLCLVPPLGQDQSHKSRKSKKKKKKKKKDSYVVWVCELCLGVCAPCTELYRSVVPSPFPIVKKKKKAKLTWEDMRRKFGNASAYSSLRLVTHRPGSKSFSCLKAKALHLGFISNDETLK